MALDKLRKLKEDMVKVKELLDFVHKREKTRREVIDIEHLVFEKRIYLRRLRKHLGIITPDPLDASPENKARKRRRMFEDGYSFFD